MTDSGVRRRPEFWPVVVLSAALVAVLGGWTAVSYLDRTRSDPGCTERIALRVVTAPSVAAAAQEVGGRLAARDRCLDLVVEARESAQVLRDLTGATPAGSAPGAAAPTAAAGPPPDVWLPESTLWLRRARDAGAFQVPETGVPVASTPVVLALDRRTAARLGWPGRAPGWPALVGAERPPLPVVLPDPAVSPLGFGALVAIRALAGDAPGAAAAIMRRLAPRTAAVTGEAPPAPGGPGRGETAVVSTEQEVLRGGGARVAVYPPSAVPGPDYPYAVLSSAGSRDGAAAFLRALLAAEGAATLARHGLRTPAGAPPAGAATPGQIRDSGYPPAPVPPPAEAAALVGAWGGVHLTARLLAVLDVSGSMAARIPGSRETRLSATVKAAQGGVRLLLDATEIGLWTFSTDLDGQRDYREVVPVGPVGPRRAQIVERLGQVRVQPDGGTGLYDTTLAAYRDSARNWTAGRINLLLVLTDGTDDNASGIGRERLLRELGALQDKRRPLPILFIGVGPDIDRAELDQIAKATGGRVALTPDPAGIRQIFFTALAEFSCLPPKCRR
ncbi:substrate-binding domain-containing protein [Phytohabitans sp. ZYX-F-186]|uniref:Substrate-binding domain-containing protein n=1 Tax=Phytohabitans maris TaxID=3071409 RepID=A0ABU0ZAQ3_9ACTN|nr:substrate-binding domain-containing protein [Phytohabitans sp. ZYX-F-186]MDQ7904058.1 substrate-binding domain-containing protein [Phytohabitans sp. ZYX-F-186]